MTSRKRRNATLPSTLAITTYVTTYHPDSNNTIDINTNFAVGRAVCSTLAHPRLSGYPD